MEVNPVFVGRDFSPRKELCFVLIPLHDPFISIFERHIKPTAAKCGLKAIKADDIYSVKPIMEDVWAYLNQARVVIADLTGFNPNVFYELGIAHTLGKEVIMISWSTSKPPFDVGNVRYINYAYPSQVEKFEKVLQETIIEVLRHPASKRASLSKERRGKKEPIVAASRIRLERLDSLTDFAREWTNTNYLKLIRSTDYQYGVSSWAIFERIGTAVRTEAVRRWKLSSGTAKDYADAVLLTIQTEFESGISAEVKKRAEELRIAEAQAQASRREDRSRMAYALAIFSSNRAPIESTALLDSLRKSGKFSDEQARDTVRKLFREGYIYESRPGVYRRVT